MADTDVIDPNLPKAALAGAPESIQAQKRALLTAVAQQGTAGAAAYKEYASQAAAQRTQAVAAAHQRAGVINAGIPASKELEASAAGAVTPFAQDAATGAKAYALENARLGTANRDYMDQAKAAVPGIRALAQSQIDIANKKAALAAADRAASSGGGAGGSDNPLAALVKSLGGIGLAKTTLGATAAQYVDENFRPPTDVKAAVKAGKYSDLLKIVPGRGKASGKSKAEALAELDKELGQAPGTLSRFLGKNSPDYKAPAKDKSVYDKRQANTIKIRNTPLYQKKYAAASAEYKRLVGDKVKATVAKQRIKAMARGAADYKDHPYIYDQIIRDL